MITLAGYITALSLALSTFGDFQFNAQMLGGTTTVATATTTTAVYRAAMRASFR